MKRIRKIIFGIMAAAMLAGCAEDKETDEAVVQEVPTPSQQEASPTQQEYMLVTVNAAVDGEQSLSKLCLEQSEYSLDLLAKWQEGDKIHIYARQGNKCFDAGEVDVEKISSDGKTCSFNIMLPVEADASQSYVVYGVCGTDSELKGNELVISSVRLRSAFSLFHAPMMFSATVNASTINAVFKHIGAYEVLHVINNTGSEIKFSHEGFSVSDWYYHSPCSYDMSKSAPELQKASAFDQDMYSSVYTHIPAGQESSLLSWYVPNGGTITNATLKAKINDTEVSSINTKTSNVVIKAGNAYHLYATWDGTELKFVDHTVTEIAPAVTYRLSSKQWVFVGDESKMTVTANTNCHISVLINGKEVKSLDDITTFDMTLPTDNPGEFDITLRASAGGIDAKDVTFKFGVRENYDDVNVKTFDICGVPVKMVLVKGGTFMMGGTAEQGKDAADDEFPIHAVSLDDYYIGQIEVTRELYKKVFGRNKEVVPDDSKYPQGDMSWNSTMEFINKLRDTTGMDFRLPTEAEWEYAARGGQKSKNYKYSGSNLVSMVANYNANSGNQTIPCGTKMNNELGIFDMSGNVWEFVSDPYSTYPEDPVYNPQGAGYNHILRGGGGSASAADCRVSRRSYYNGKSGWDGDLASWDFGIRLVIRP